MENLKPIKNNKKPTVSDCLTIISNIQKVLGVRSSITLGTNIDYTDIFFHIFPNNLNNSCCKLYYSWSEFLQDYYDLMEGANG